MRRAPWPGSAGRSRWLCRFLGSKWAMWLPPGGVIDLAVRGTGDAVGPLPARGITYGPWSPGRSDPALAGQNQPSKAAVLVGVCGRRRRGQNSTAYSGHRPDNGVQSAIGDPCRPVGSTIAVGTPKPLPRGFPRPCGTRVENADFPVLGRVVNRPVRCQVGRDVVGTATGGDLEIGGGGLWGAKTPSPGKALAQSAKRESAVGTAMGIPSLAVSWVYRVRPGPATKVPAAIRRLRGRTSDRGSPLRRTALRW